MWWNGASYFEFDGKSVKAELATSSEFLNGGKFIVEQTIALKEPNKSKKAGLWELES